MFRANVLKVMIASPGDVAEERRIITEEIHRWNDANASARQLVLLPVKWETHSTPQMGGHPQQIINRQLLSDADILIGIFGTRIGTPTPEYISGTVEEIKRHVADGKTAKLYFSNVPVAPSEFDNAQYALVERFREECSSTGLYAVFDSAQSLSREFKQHLDIELNHPRYRWLVAPEATSDTPPLSEDAISLLKAMADTDEGLAIIQETQDGKGLRIGEKELMDGSARSAARWRGALRELEIAEALESPRDDVYRLTAKGYTIADESDGTQEPKVNAFEEERATHIIAVAHDLTSQQRDLLRLVLLQGGSARGDVIFRAWKSSIPFNGQGLYGPLVNKGLVAVTENRNDGFNTIIVNGGMTTALQKVLFPRNENDDSVFFNV